MPDNSLSNWGRWGPADELGSLNILTPEMVRKAAGLIRTGQVYSLAMPLAADGPQWPLRHKTWRVTTYYNDPASFGGADDVVIMHSHSGTHIDALCHAWYGNQLYNGFNAGEHVGSRGATRNAIDRLPSIVGRGVLLDVAGWKGVEHLNVGEPITASDLDQCAASQGIEIQPGDSLLIRTGWMRVFSKDRALFDSGEPGIDMSTVPWLKQHDIVAVCADNHGVEVMDRIPPSGIPVHRAVLRDLGIYLVENLNLEDLAADRVYECLLIIAPLPLAAGVGSPVNPIAIT